MRMPNGQLRMPRLGSWDEEGGRQAASRQPPRLSVVPAHDYQRCRSALAGNGLVPGLHQLQQLHGQMAPPHHATALGAVHHECPMPHCARQLAGWLYAWRPEAPAADSCACSSGAMAVEGRQTCSARSGTLPLRCRHAAAAFNLAAACQPAASCLSIPIAPSILTRHRLRAASSAGRRTRFALPGGSAMRA